MKETLLNRKAVYLLQAVSIFIIGVMSRPTLGFIAHEVETKVSKLFNVEVTPDENPYDSVHYDHKSNQYEILGKTNEIVFLGDSRVEGAEWNELLQRKDVSNRGLRGDTTSGVLARLSMSIPHNIRICIIQLGINDLSKGVPIDRVLSNYEKIIVDLQKRVNARVLITPVILAGKDQASLNLTITEFNQMLLKIALLKNAEWIDVNESICPAGTLPVTCSSDCIHLNGIGYQKFASAIKPFLLEKANRDPGSN